MLIAKKLYAKVTKAGTPKLYKADFSSVNTVAKDIKYRTNSQNNKTIANKIFIINSLSFLSEYII